MPHASAEDVIHAFARVIRDTLEAHEPIHVPGLGSFGIDHQQSQMIETEEGEAKMAPPRDTISFTSEDAA